MRPTQRRLRTTRRLLTPADFRDRDFDLRGSLGRGAIAAAALASAARRRCFGIRFEAKRASDTVPPALGAERHQCVGNARQQHQPHQDIVDERSHFQPNSAVAARKVMNDPKYASAKRYAAMMMG